MVVFVTLAATLALITGSFGSLQQRVAERVVTSDTVALQQAALRAHALGAAPAGARAAYARAPYRAPALRYVYAIGWSAGTRHRSLCVLGQLDVEGTKGWIVAAVRKSKAALREIRKLHLTATQAGTAFASGFLSACS